MNLWMVVRGKEKLTGRHIGVVGIIFVILLIFAGWMADYSSRPEFCGSSCHEMNSTYQSWQMSAHKNVGCEDCHGEAGAIGLVKTKAKGMKEVYVHITSSKIEPKANEHDINCYNCHQDKVKLNVDKALAAKDPHTVKHFDDGMTCVACHSGLVHDTKLNNAVPSRDTCTRCHLDAMQK
ncbi:Cytochrome c-type protein NapC [Sporomusa ovata DSM 2662]|uniref:Cytochrome c family protein n=1 Tax=Sporomusa ovata TaxID=2378 RepID=A0A0U1KXD3_9FIRM|nr:NapC/NirT family cytochrome c [Sporomusa ovata]EQB28237.1 putative cytochrome c-type protein [Sporomusa ovata DSM 2662]CQR71779.1 Cytochrome c family protein [Sporomusa ovata]